MNLVRILDDLLHKFTKIVLVILGLALVAVVFSGVVMRYMFKSPLSWGYELSVLLFMWVSFLGIAAATKTNNHISFDFVMNLFPESLRAKVNAAVSLVIIVLCGFSAYLGYDVLSGMLWQKFQTIPLSLGWLYGALPLGFALVGLHTLADLMEQISQIFRPGVPEARKQNV